MEKYSISRQDKWEATFGRHPEQAMNVSDREIRTFGNRRSHASPIFYLILYFHILRPTQDLRPHFPFLTTRLILYYDLLV